jgi:hypothetical protein
MRRYVIPALQHLNFDTLLGYTRKLASWTLSSLPSHLIDGNLTRFITLQAAD